MRILFLSQIVPYPPHGGVLQRGYHIIRELAKRHAIHLLAFLHPDVLKTPDEVNAARSALLRYCTEVEFFDLWVKRSRATRLASIFLALFLPHPFSVLAHHSRRFQKRILQLTTTESFDLIHYDTIALAQFSAGSKARPRVLAHHNIESRLMERRAQFEKTPLARAYLLMQERRLRRYEANQSPKYDVNIVVSEQDSRELKAIRADIRTVLVPNGVDTDYFLPGEEEAVPSLIYAGGMNMFANRDAVLYFLKEIWPCITLEQSNIRFYALGQDPPPELVRMGRQDSRIVVTGYVDDIRPWVTRAWVYVVPLRVGGGTRLKVLDAMAMGKPVVSTSIGCEGLEVLHNRDILICDEPTGFAQHVLALLADPAQRKRLGASARQTVEHKYSWEMIGQALEKAYREALARARIA